jgi:hypothetical protein
MSDGAIFVFRVVGTLFLLGQLTIVAMSKVREEEDLNQDHLRPRQR